MLKNSHIEFEDSEEEGADSVIVTGGLNFVKGDKAIVNSQVGAKRWQSYNCAKLGVSCKRP